MSKTFKDTKKLDGSFRGWWRFLSARRDGSGKLNTFDETNNSGHNNTALKRVTSKDTRRFGKE